jgi:hypothetical protein
MPIFRAASSKRNLQTLSRRSFDELRQQAAQSSEPAGNVRGGIFQERSDVLE